jgi:chromosome segregation ATPase
MIEDEKFSRYKTYGLREEVRQEYDQERAKLSNVETRLGDKEKTIAEIGEGEYKRLEDEKVRGDEKIKRLKEEMDTLTQSVEGGKPTSEHPAGIIGNNQTIEKLYDLIDFIKDYLGKI